MVLLGMKPWAGWRVRGGGCVGLESSVPWWKRGHGGAGQGRASWDGASPAPAWVWFQSSAVSRAAF